VNDTSRRNFLAAGLALPAAGLASTTSSPAPAPQQGTPSKGKINLPRSGQDRLKVSTVGYGAMITSDPTVITRAADMASTTSIRPADTPAAKTSACWQPGWSEAEGRFHLVQVRGHRQAGCLAQLDTSLKELNTDHLDVWLLHKYDTAAQISDELVDALRTASSRANLGSSA